MNLASNLRHGREHRKCVTRLASRRTVRVDIVIDMMRLPGAGGDRVTPESIGRLYAVPKGWKLVSHDYLTFERDSRITYEGSAGLSPPTSRHACCRVSKARAA
jgi:hypothetical protein